MDNARIATGMPVMSRDGVRVGAVTDVDENGFTMSNHSGGGTHRVGMADVARVDEHVHLDRDAAFFASAGSAAPAAAAGAASGMPSWLVPLLIGLALLALLLWGLGQCSKRDDTPDTAALPPTEQVDIGMADNAPMLPALQAYLDSSEPAPRTFVFDKLNFDTSEAAIRAEDAETLKLLATALQAHPNARVKIVGYADARGAAGANADLGKRRADAVAAALRRGGVSAGAIETGSVGEANPRDTNATAPGQFENRRTELQVLQK